MSTQIAEKLENRIIIVEINKEFIGLNLNLLQEVLEVKQIRKLTKLPLQVCGVFNLRNSILSVFDLNYILFNRISKDRKSQIQNFYRMVVLQSENGIIGLLVDKILDIVEVTQDKREKVPNSIATKIDLEFIEDIIVNNEQIIKILNFNKILIECIRIPDVKAKSNGRSQISHTDISNKQINEKKSVESSPSKPETAVKKKSSSKKPVKTPISTSKKTSSSKKPVSKPTSTSKKKSSSKKSSSKKNSSSKKPISKKKLSESKKSEKNSSD